MDGRLQQMGGSRRVGMLYLIQVPSHNDVLLASRMDSSYTGTDRLVEHKHRPIDPCRTGKGGWDSQTHETFGKYIS